MFEFRNLVGHEQFFITEARYNWFFLWNKNVIWGLIFFRYNQIRYYRVSLLLINYFIFTGCSRTVKKLQRETFGLFWFRLEQIRFCNLFNLHFHFCPQKLQTDLLGKWISLNDVKNLI